MKGLEKIRNDIDALIEKYEGRIGKFEDWTAKDGSTMIRAVLTFRVNKNET